MSKDEISVSLGVEPQVAVDLAESLARAPNPGAAQAQLPPPPPSIAKPSPSGGSGSPSETSTTDPPKKKPKAPRPEAGSKRFLLYLQGLEDYRICLLCQGSDLEVTVMDDTDLETFVNNWKSSCTSAEGKATTVKSSLFGSFVN